MTGKKQSFRINLNKFLDWQKFMVNIIRTFYTRLNKMRQQAKLKEDALKGILQCEIAGSCPSVDDLAQRLGHSAARMADLVDQMVEQGDVRIENEEMHLTNIGKQHAIQLLRAHRLWETYLARFTGYAAHRWHHHAEQKEHQLNSVELLELEKSLGYPRYDPHGDPIPTATGEIDRIEGQLLSKIPANQLHKIIHVADEPPERYAELVKRNIASGCKILVTQQLSDEFEVLVDGRPQIIHKQLADAIIVIPSQNGMWPTDSHVFPLSDLKLGEACEVINVSYACRSNERRRLLDLGILPGTIITAELLSPSGDPKAYRVRGALIALRHQQANWITVKRIS